MSNETTPVQEITKPKRRPVPSAKQPTILDIFADKTIALFGTWAMFIFHIVWFALWIVLNLDIQILTMWVSLEAILLSLLILMAQKRQVEKDEIRAITDLEIDRHTEKQTRIIMEMLRELGEKSKIKEYKVEQNPEKNVQNA